MTTSVRLVDTFSMSDASAAAAAAPPTTLTIVIPARNEEETIGATVERCLTASGRMRDSGVVRDVRIIVVSDGSTDRTAGIVTECARCHETVQAIVFEKNRGYGAALKEGFRHSRSELVGFLDADGTCNPEYFSELIRVLQTSQAVIALGSRLGPASRMPWIRALGNRLYATLLEVLSGTPVTDTASGMRVIRRAALRDLYPLPDGLHFTPAMSARAILSGLPVVEVPIPYADRVGHSKLRLIRDGVHFLFAIRDALLLYQPNRFFGAVGSIALLLGVAWGLYPVEFYLRHGRLEEWMMYRLLLAGLLVACCCVFVSAGLLARQMLSLLNPRRPSSSATRFVANVLSPRRLTALAVIAATTALLIAWPGAAQYLRTGEVTMHWSRPLAAMFLLEVAVLAWTHAVLQKFVSLWEVQLLHDRSLSDSVSELA